MKTHHQAKVESVANCYLAHREGGICCDPMTDAEAERRAWRLASEVADHEQISEGIELGRRIYNNS